MNPVSAALPQYLRRIFVATLKGVSDTEKLDILRLQLGTKSKQKLEDMLRSGVPINEILDYFLKHGMTQEEENEELKNKVKNLLSEGNLSTEEFLSIIGQDLSVEEKQKLNQLLQQGSDLQQRFFKDFWRVLCSHVGLRLTL